jgi:D-tyrosyl-tRNA(Tyr) deacylase
MLSIVAMKALLQRVSSARVEIDGRSRQRDRKWIARFSLRGKGRYGQRPRIYRQKVSKLRIFEDDHGKMNLSIMDIKGEVLGLTIHARCVYAKRNRPSLIPPRPPNGQGHVRHVRHEAPESRLSVQTGVFAKSMDVSLTNDGPVTILIDSRE